MVLLNSMLSAILIFYLGFMKMPTKVWKKVVAIQRSFLWGGANGSKKICWVAWKDACKPKMEGGLGVRDLRLVNLALLGKWRWILLQKETGVWRMIIAARYGSLAPTPHLGGRFCGLRRSSLWWKDVSLLGTKEHARSDWFADCVMVKVGDGLNTSF